MAQNSFWSMHKLVLKNWDGASFQNLREHYASTQVKLFSLKVIYNIS